MSIFGDRAYKEVIKINEIIKMEMSICQEDKLEELCTPGPPFCGELQRHQEDLSAERSYTLQGLL